MSKTNSPNYKHTNKLINETSPYLLQHAHNPVNWYPWGDEAIALARKEDKPIFLSIGYSACHWCHVMERESFENEAIAELLNAHFISVKVDREERPDVDDIYMTSVQLMSGSGGWPLSVWLTPDLQPFFGGTYFPPEDRWGRAGFKNILSQIIKLWYEKRDELNESAGQITAYLSQMNEGKFVDSDLTMDIWHKAAKDAESRFDKRYGGFGKEPKFPQPMELSFLLRYYFHTGKKEILNMVEYTLQKMADGGIYDHLGGGFHRYSTDEKWLVPHFEKMLYDNALLSQVYIEAFQITKKSFYADIAQATLNYVLQEMTSPEGGFYSTQDADSEGEEGRFYVWQKSEIDKILGEEESKLFCNVYDVSETGNWEGKNILHLSQSIPQAAIKFNMDVEELVNRLETGREKLLQKRSERIHPQKDDKILTAWNGMMVSALCKGYQVFHYEKYLHAANKAIDFLFQNMYIDDHILRTYRNGKAHIAGYLSDYAFLVQALIDLYESSFDRHYFAKAIEINDLMLKYFWDEANGGFYFSTADDENSIVRTRNPYDNAIPSGNSIAVMNLLRLSRFTDNRSLSRFAEQSINIHHNMIEKSPSAFTALISSLDFLWGKSSEIVVAGDFTNDEFKHGIATLHEFFFPNKIFAYADPALAGQKEIFPVIDGKISNAGSMDIYVCENYACHRPFSTIREFQKYYDSLQMNRKIPGEQ